MLEANLRTEWRNMTFYDEKEERRGCLIREVLRLRFVDRKIENSSAAEES